MHPLVLFDPLFPEYDERCGPLPSLHMAGKHLILTPSQPVVPVIVTLLCYIFKIEKPTKTRWLAMAICFPYLIFRVLFKTFTDDYVEFGEDPHYSIPYLFMLANIISAAAANIFNKKFLTGTKVSIVTFAFFAYLFACIGSFLLFFIEQFVKAPHTIQFSILPLANLMRAEEIINVLIFN